MKKSIKNLSIVVTLIAFSTVIVIACSDTTESDNNVQFQTKSLQSTDYLNQIPLVTGGDSDSDRDFILDNEMFEKMEDPSVSWVYFDNLYSSSLPNSVKQNISYIILCKKDLIGLVDSSPSNTTLITALKKHVDNLAGTNYLGYTALYHALYALRNTGTQTNYVKAKAAQIVAYAANDPFHPDMLQGGPSGVGEELYDKLTANYAYVSQIAAMQ